MSSQISNHSDSAEALSSGLRGASSDPLDRVLGQVREALGSLRYGNVLITVHDGVVVQIDRTEKVRLR